MATIKEITLSDESFWLEKIKTNDKGKIHLSVSRSGCSKMFYRISILKFYKFS